MPKCSVFVRELNFTDPLMRAELDAQVTSSNEVAPGQIRKMGDWYWLTYLKVVKVKNFNPGIFDLDEKEVNSIRAVAFQIIGNKLIVKGSKGDIKEIQLYFMSLALKLAGNAQGDTVNYDKYFKLVEREVDLKQILEKLEQNGVIQNIKKVRLVKFEVKLGQIDNCIVKSQDYPGVKDAMEKDPEQVFGISVDLKQPEKTQVYFDLDDQVRVISKADVNVEEVAISYATLQLASADLASPAAPAGPSGWDYLNQTAESVDSN